MSIVKIKKVLDTFDIPKEFRIDKSTYVSNSEKFFENHIARVESEIGSNQVKKAYYRNMVKAMNVLKKMKLTKK